MSICNTRVSWLCNHVRFLSNPSAGWIWAEAAWGCRALFKLNFHLNVQNCFLHCNLILCTQKPICTLMIKFVNRLNAKAAWLCILRLFRSGTAWKEAKSCVHRTPDKPVGTYSPLWPLTWWVWRQGGAELLCCSIWEQNRSGGSCLCPWLGTQYR